MTVYSGASGAKNGVGIMVGRNLKDEIVNVKRIRDKISSIK